jgi:hypothetical protein
MRESAIRLNVRGVGKHRRNRKPEQAGAFALAAHQRMIDQLHEPRGPGFVFRLDEHGADRMNGEGLLMAAPLCRILRARVV